MEILRGASLFITQCTDEERRCADFVRELLDLRDGLQHVDILSQKNTKFVEFLCIHSLQCEAKINIRK